MLVLGACGQPSIEPEAPVPDRQLMGPGEAMVENLCAGCHAIGAYDQSAHTEAPALRDLSKQIDLASLEQPLRDGIMVDHPDMPEFAFEPHHVDALLYYLEHIQTEE
jgi:mono/diheme cytochrome c family protein